MKRTIELYVLLRLFSKIKKSKRNDNLLANAIRKLDFDSINRISSKNSRIELLFLPITKLPL